MLPTNKQLRKERPMYRGLLDYFPDALAEVAHVSFVGNEQHNPGEPLHWDKEKSTDHGDCIIRHLAEAGTVDEDGLRHSAKVAWRALALLQIEIESPPVGRPVTLPPPLVNPQWVIDLPVYHPAVAKMPRVYLSGPMRGIEEFNFPMFDKIRDLLAASCTVISPADMDRNLGHTDARGYAKRDVAEILTCDTICLLPGWCHSVGAMAEFMVARWIGLKCLLAIQTWPKHPNGKDHTTINLCEEPSYYFQSVDMDTALKIFLETV